MSAAVGHEKMVGFPALNHKPSPPHSFPPHTLPQVPLSFAAAKMQAKPLISHLKPHASPSVFQEASDTMKRMKMDHLDAINEMEASYKQMQKETQVRVVWVADFLGVGLGTNPKH